MRLLPSGTVTLLFTDIEGSTRLLQELGRDRYVEALTIHRRLLREAFTRRGGVEVEMQGDSFHFAFSSARAALAAAAAGQRALGEYEWPAEPIRVRIGVHTGEPVIAEGLYAGLDVHRAARVMSAAHGGQVLVSSATAEIALAERSDDALELRELGEFRLKDLGRPARLYQLGDGKFPPPRSVEHVPTSLPVQPTPLVGRDEELAEVIELVRRNRLVTLTGPGGTGKTRLALQAAAELADEYPDGVWFVDLATLADPNLVIPAIAHALAVREQPGEAILDTLAAHLTGRRALVAVDNFEHVTDAAPALGQLLARIDGTAFLVTSRAPLRVSAELEYAVPPLAEPDATALFAERARAAKSTFGVDGNRAVVAEICRRLDRLPLAIELAATRIKLLPEQALLERLDERLGLLTGGPRDRDPRQQTLRATIDWSHDLLGDDARMLFRRLAVFAGGGTLDAIEAICDLDGRLDILDALTALVDNSLLRLEESTAEPRFAMLETIHDYARERFLSCEPAEQRAIEGRHAEYYAALVVRAERDLSGARQAEAIRLLDREYDNVRVALSRASPDVDEVRARIAGHLAYYWYARGLTREALTTLERLAGALDDVPPAVRARVVDSRALFTALAGSVGAAVELSDAGIALARDAGDDAALAHSLVIRQMVLGGAEDTAGYQAAALEAVELARRTGDDLTLAASLNNLSDSALVGGDYAKARAYGEESLRLFQQLGDPFDTAAVLGNLASAALGLGDARTARALLADGVDAARQSGTYHRYGWLLDTLGALADAEHAPRRAAVLAGAFDALVEEHGHPGGAPRPFEVDRRERVVAAARLALGGERFSAAYEHGRRLDPLEALQLGLAPPSSDCPVENG